jgi:hypothetical protein
MRPLQKAIEAYRAAHEQQLDQRSRALLVRLGSDSRAVRAFARLKLKHDEDEAAIVRACVEAEQLSRPAAFAKRVKKAQAAKKQTEELRKAAAILRRFVNKVAAEQKNAPDPLWMRQLEWPDNLAAMGRGLAQIERRIEAEVHLAELNLFRLGATRKSGAAEAGRIAAIKWLANEVKRITDKAHLSEIADLAGAIVGTDVSLDLVRAAQRARGQWQWIAPKLSARSRAK